MTAAFDMHDPSFSKPARLPPTALLLHEGLLPHLPLMTAQTVDSPFSAFTRRRALLAGVASPFAQIDRRGAVGL